MKKFILLIITLIIMFIPILLLTGCSAKNIDDLAYIVSIGFDEGENERLKIFFEISTPTGSSNSSGSSGGGSGAETSSKSSVISVECSSIDTGLSKLDSYISKQADLSHCNIIIFSSKLAEKGIHNCLYSLINNVDIKPSCDLLVSTCSIEEFFTNSSNTLESYSSNYETLNKDLTGFTEIVSISDFFAKTTDSFGEPYAILCGLSTNDITSVNIAGSSGNEDQDGKALKTLGLAVFKQDRLVRISFSFRNFCPSYFNQ